MKNKIKNFISVVLFCVGLMIFSNAIASTGSGTLVTSIKEWFDLLVVVAYYLTLIACIILSLIMVFTKNWGLIYWVAGTAIVAYIIGNVETFFRDVGVTGAIF